jgi:hexosaminidase
MRNAAAVFGGGLLLLAGCVNPPAHRAPVDPPRRYAVSIVPQPRFVRFERGVFVWHNPAVIDARLSRALPTANVAGSYTLDVSPRGIRIRARDPAGLFYARETLEQATTSAGSKFIAPAMHVEDAPRYSWRGIHLDVARHYFDLRALEKLVDAASRYKLNILHLHFTDDRAWRLPSKAFPRLPSTQHYTAQQIHELVRYAGRHFMTIVPEIDVPAHSTAAIRAYPQLACGQSDELCPARANAFADAVLAEVARMFPAPLIHTGGDEVESWTTSERSAFERHIAATLHRLNREPVVWDDEADVAGSGSTIVVWHLGDAARRAALHHRIVMAPDGPLYFNAAQGDRSQEPPASRYVSTLEEVYSYSPDTPALGMEATLWTERIATPDALWYMLLPRELALAESAWDLPTEKNWTRFYGALGPQLTWLGRHGYTFRIPNVMFGVKDGSARFGSISGQMNGAVATVDRPAATLALSDALPGATLWYRIGEDSPWRRYRRAIAVAVGSDVYAYATANRAHSAVSKLSIRAAGRRRLFSRSFTSIVSP